MIKLNLKAIGLTETIARMRGLRGGLAKTLEEGMKEAAFIVEGKAKLQLTQGPNRAIKTGFLRASVGVASVSAARATVQAGAYYGLYVHEGTRYMRARPFMAAGLQDAIPEIENIFGRRLKTLIETV